MTISPYRDTSWVVVGANEDDLIYVSCVEKEGSYRLFVALEYRAELQVVTVIVKNPNGSPNLGIRSVPATNPAQAMIRGLLTVESIVADMWEMVNILGVTAPIEEM